MPAALVRAARPFDRAAGGRDRHSARERAAAGRAAAGTQGRARRLAVGPGEGRRLPVLDAGPRLLQEHVPSDVRGLVSLARRRVRSARQPARRRRARDDRDARGPAPARERRELRRRARRRGHQRDFRHGCVSVRPAPARDRDRVAVRGRLRGVRGGRKASMLDPAAFSPGWRLSGFKLREYRKQYPTSFGLDERVAIAIRRSSPRSSPSASAGASPSTTSSASSSACCCASSATCPVNLLAARTTLPTAATIAAVGNKYVVNSLTETSVTARLVNVAVISAFAMVLIYMLRLGALRADRRGRPSRARRAAQSQRRHRLGGGLLHRDVVGLLACADGRTHVTSGVAPCSRRAAAVTDGFESRAACSARVSAPAPRPGR